jgi:type IV pilus assembly protein PilA
MMKSLTMKKKGGFTLVELMVVIAIIGILAAMAVTQLVVYRESSFIASMQSDAKAIQTAEEAYFADTNHNVYLPTTDPATDLKDYGFKALSVGNSVAITCVDTSKDFKIVVSSTKTGKKTTYDSALGTTVTN